ncbi:MAG TPA: class I SAM-dependent methyltransferase [Gemmataceae bacterium]|nr:class I SAM-dependent methyltransferase [Gemmataceae bacterium]
MSVNWSAFWERYPKKGGEDLFKQVGKTVAGVPITMVQLQASIKDIACNLELNEADTLLDLCCGNGLLTCQLAMQCKHVVGIDFSAPLIEQAKGRCSRSNVEYRLLDIKELAALQGEYAEYFDKVLLNDAIAYLDERELSSVLRHALQLSKSSVTLMIGDILDNRLKWHFFDTWRRRIDYLVWIKLLGRDPGLGKWWNFSRLGSIARELGLSCESHRKSNWQHNAHYRIDAVLRAFS